VSALAHYLEEERIATVAISLIRPQTENTRPPRALWVPFELGRPFGPPGEAAFQRRVILAALGMLERDNGPVIIEDFPDDDPRWQPGPGWRPMRFAPWRYRLCGSDMPILARAWRRRSWLSIMAVRCRARPCAVG
jgi:hypothetical protein